MHSRTRWLVTALLLVTTAYALAEELTLVTYYPSPRGVYNELRVGGGGPWPAPSGVLHVIKPTDEIGRVAFRVDDVAGDASPFVITQDGRVGVGTASPKATLQLSDPADLVSLFLQGGTGGGLQPDSRLRFLGEWQIDQPNGIGGTGADEGFELRYSNSGASGGPGDMYFDQAYEDPADGTRVHFRTNTGNGSDGTNPIPTREVMTFYRGNVGIGETNPKSPAPNGTATGNLDANDVYLRSVDRWASQSGQLSSSYVGSCSIAGVAHCKCNAGERIMLIESSPSPVGMGNGCLVEKQGTADVYGHMMSDGCVFACFR